MRGPVATRIALAAGAAEFFRHARQSQAHPAITVTVVLPSATSFLFLGSDKVARAPCTYCDRRIGTAQWTQVRASTDDETDCDCLRPSDAYVADVIESVG
jgi:hypothetical protein